MLKKAGLQRASFQSAGSDSNAPDAELTLKGGPQKVEVKLDLKVDFGQGSLDYDLEKKKWILGGADTESAKQMREFLEILGVPRIVNTRWGAKGAPRKFTVPTAQFTKKDVDHDYANFHDFFVQVPSDSVAKYYNTKKTYYIQIGGGYGFYWMGRDIANLGVPKFQVNLRLRVRLKRGGSLPINNYRFSTALQAISLPESKADLENPEFLMAIKARQGKKL
jgi:hypothetical protein